MNWSARFVNIFSSHRGGDLKDGARPRRSGHIGGETRRHTPRDRQVPRKHEGTTPAAAVSLAPRGTAVEWVRWLEPCFVFGSRCRHPAPDCGAGRRADDTSLSIFLCQTWIVTILLVKQSVLFDIRNVWLRMNARDAMEILFSGFWPATSSAQD